MEAASAALEFETAAAIRDRIRALTMIQSHQDINVGGRGGRRRHRPARRRRARSASRCSSSAAAATTATAPIFPATTRPWTAARSWPPSSGPVLRQQAAAAGDPGQPTLPRRRPDRRGAERARPSARSPAEARRAGRPSASWSNMRCQRPRGAGAAAGGKHVQPQGAGTAGRGCFGLDGPPERIEVYDNSHIQGRNPVGAMIVAGPEGF